MKRLLTIILLSFSVVPLLLSQNDITEDKVTDILQKNYKTWKLKKSDVSEFKINDSHRSESSGVTHIYINQLFNGIPISNAILGLVISPKGELLYSTNQFEKNIAKKINPVIPKISPGASIQIFASHLGFEMKNEVVLKNSEVQNEYLFEQLYFTTAEIPVGLFYKNFSEGKIKLCWRLEFDLTNSDDYWTAWIDAIDGQVLLKENNTIYCSFPGHLQGSNYALDKVSHPLDQLQQPTLNTVLVDEFPSDSSQMGYRIFALPVESPLHGNAEVKTDSLYPKSSIFGWHDTDGVEGAEYTITRGNNVHAFQDTDGNELSSEDEPDGGPNLLFDYIYDASLDPAENTNAIVTNLFYTVNFLHDWSYLFGFNEEAGNFQENNYENEGDGGDYIIAQAMALEKDENNQPITNNANFSTSRDGSNGTINMFLWNSSSGENRIKLLSPLEIFGPLQSAPAQFGQPVGRTALNGKIKLADDNVSTSNDACQDLTNTTEISGNIAMIDRGICEFGSKVLNAENAGAIAALICNVSGVNGGTGDELLTGGMGAGIDGSKVSIPSLFLKKSDCDLIKMVLKGGTDVEVSLQLEESQEGPSTFPSSMDNGIVAHEYAHGISLRLTGGRTSPGCLNNDEQMGEGWSDFFALAVTHKVGDEGITPRGIGNYVLQNPISGKGIRSFPYSTDMSVNPLTYNFIRTTTSPHRLGEVWAACLWDMYWEFIELYGFNPDWTIPESGNFKAVQLVVDGMKFQNCSPGFIDGRDGILAADLALFGGAHECLIWKVFARRGIGFDALQGSSQNRADNEEGFQTLPTCIKELKIEKSATTVIVPGEEIEVELTITNHKESLASDVVVIENLVAGQELATNFSDYEAIHIGDSIQFNLGNLISGEKVTLNYNLTTDPELSSERIIFDDFEQFGTTLIQFPLQPDNFEWQQVDQLANSGTISWFIPGDTTNLDQALVTVESIPISGDKLVLKFSHRFNTEIGFDGGFVEVSFDQGLTWLPISREQFLKNGYNSTLDFFTFGIPGIFGFSGQSNGWMDSYIDLSPYANMSVLIRFRFGCDSTNKAPGEDSGWFIDDFEIMNLEQYMGALTCVQSQEGDFACDNAPTLIQSSQSTTPVQQVVADPNNFKVYPNPVKDLLHIQIEGTGKSHISIISKEGLIVHSRELTLNNGVTKLDIKLKGMPPGLYFVHLVLANKISSRKLVIMN